MMCNNPKLDHVDINAYKKFGYILYESSQDIERKRNYDGWTNGRTNSGNDRQPKFYKAPQPFFQSGAINS